MLKFLITLLSFSAMVTALSGCGGGGAKEARTDPGSDTEPTHAVISPKTLSERTKILRDLIDRELKTSSAGRTPKLKFFKTIAPAVVETMLVIESERATVIAYADAEKAGGMIPDALKTGIAFFFKRYKTTGLAELRLRVDAIPLDMLFTQSAIESASGLSAVARDCRNLFGVHAADKSQACPGHSILANYPNFTGSIERYVLLLNTGSAYRSLRSNRAKLRVSDGEGAALDSSVLVKGLLPYSERGEAYVHDVATGIRADRLDVLYRKFMQKIQ